MSRTEHYFMTIARSKSNPSRDVCSIILSGTVELVEEKTASYVAETAEWLNALQQVYGDNPAIEIPTLYVTRVFFGDLNASVNIVIQEEGDDETIREDRIKEARKSVGFMRQFS